jgi:DNA-binding transcriptional regulator YiaG
MQSRDSLLNVQPRNISVNCQISYDHIAHIPKRSYALYQAREALFSLFNDTDCLTVIHPEARTTHQIRAEIKAATGPTQKALAEKYNVSEQTIRKWQRREVTTDKSHCPDRLQTPLSAAQEGIVAELRKTFFLPLDDLLVVTREFINPKASRAGLARTLKRYGISNLNKMNKALKAESVEKKPKKSFKDYEPGFVHIDIKYLPRMEDESWRKYLFVAIDRASRWVHMKIINDKTAKTTSYFIKDLYKVRPIKIKTILTDNGKEFTDRFTANGEREPTGQHLFDQACTKLTINHRLIPPKHHQTNYAAKSPNYLEKEFMNRRVLTLIYRW